MVPSRGWLAVVSVLAAAVALSAQAPAPTITTVSPSSAYNFQATTITISGTGFSGTPTITLGVNATYSFPGGASSWWAADATQVIRTDDETLTAVIPAGLPPGKYYLTLTNPDAQSVTKIDAFESDESHSGDLGPVLTNSQLWSNGSGPLIGTFNGLAYFKGPGPTTLSYSIRRASIQSDGDFSDPHEFAGAAATDWAAPLAASDGRFIWVLRQHSPDARIEWATIDGQGDVGSSWQSAPVAVSVASIQAFFARSGYLYFLGFVSNVPKVLKASIGIDGSPGAWQVLPYPTDSHQNNTFGTLMPYGPGTEVATVGPYLFNGFSFPCEEEYHTASFEPRSAHRPCDLRFARFDPAGDPTFGYNISTWTRTVDPEVFVGGVGGAGNYLYLSKGWRRALVRADGSLSYGPETSAITPRFQWGGYVYSPDGLTRAEFSPFKLTSAVAKPEGGVAAFVGTDFLSGMTVTVDGVTPTNVIVSDSHHLTATVPAHTAGPVPVTLAHPDGRIATGSLFYDASPPSGSVVIAGGADVVPIRNVTLTLQATDDSGISPQMAFSDDGTSFTAFEPFKGSRQWTLPDTNGLQRVYVFVKFADAVGNERIVSDDILLDRRGPTGTVSINQGAVTTVVPAVTARVSASSVIAGGKVGFVSFSFDGVTWGPYQDYSAFNDYPLSLPAGDGPKLVYARFKDSYSNTSVVSDSIDLNTTVLMNSLTINSGAQFTNTATIRLAIGGKPDTWSMQVAGSPAFTDDGWEPYSAFKTWALPNSDGNHGVYARFKDANGSVSAIVSDDIILDTTAPSAQVAIVSATSLTLSASDGLSGVAEMTVSPSPIFMGAVWEPYVTSRSWGGGTPYVRFRDGAGNISAVVTVAGQPPQTAPFGSFDFPGANARVHGAVPFGGWALDDKAVTAVRIYRDSVAGEAQQGLILIGDAVFVDGARPDVASQFATLPQATRAGWGLLVLTSVLPNGGNGPYTFHAYALDGDGQQTRLGSRTVTGDNATATVPFGTIDTPGQGATIGGASYLNFGWALTPQPKAIPTDGSTIDVYVDGQLVGHPTYNQRRADIAGLFPGLANTDGAVGFFYLDTTRYADGLHTIGWTVTDNAGATDGIGSRYFRIQNGPALTAAPMSAVAPTILQRAAGIEVVSDICVPGSRAGYDATAAWRPFEGSDGVVRVEAPASRVELRFCERIRSASLVRDGQRLALPTGASVAAGGDTFAWEPGPAFLGDFDLLFEFAGSTPAAPVTRIVRVTIAR